MKYINIVFKKLNESYGWIFEAINNFLLWQLMTLKNFLILAPWPFVVLGVAAIAYFASGKKIGTTVFVGFCTFFIGFCINFWTKAIETTSIMLISIFLCVTFGIPVGILMSRSERIRDKILPILDLMQTIPAFVYLIPGYNVIWTWSGPSNYSYIYLCCSPLVRLTDLGIRLVDKEVTEAADAFGADKNKNYLEFSCL